MIFAAEHVLMKSEKLVIDNNKIILDMSLLKIDLEKYMEKLKSIEKEKIYNQSKLLKRKKENEQY